MITQLPFLPNLKSVAIFSDRIKTKHVISIIEHLKTKQQVEVFTIDLSSNVLNYAEIFLALSQIKHIRTFGLTEVSDPLIVANTLCCQNVASMDMTPLPGSRTFGSCLSHVFKLPIEKFGLSCCSVNIDDIYQALKTTIRLKTFCFHFVRFDGEYHLLTKMIIEFKLKYLKFTEVQRDDTDNFVKCIADALKDPNCCLEELSFNDCSVGKGMQYLFESLSVNKSLKSISFSGNNKFSFSQKFTNAIDKNTTLQNIDLDWCKLGRRQIQNIFASVLKNPQIKSFTCQSSTGSYLDPSAGKSYNLMNQNWDCKMRIAIHELVVLKKIYLMGKRKHLKYGAQCFESENCTKTSPWFTLFLIWIFKQFYIPNDIIRYSILNSSLWLYDTKKQLYGIIWRKSIK